LPTIHLVCPLPISIIFESLITHSVCPLQPFPPLPYRKNKNDKKIWENAIPPEAFAKQQFMQNLGAKTAHYVGLELLSSISLGTTAIPRRH